MPVLECSRCNELYYSAHGSTELSCDVCDCPVWRVFEDEVSFHRVSELIRTMQPGDHAAVVYTEAEQAADFCVEYLRAGAENGEELVMAVAKPLRVAIESRLSPEETAALRISEPEEVYADFDAERVANRYLDIIRALERPVRTLSAIDAVCASSIDLADWRRYERRVHELILDLGVTALCAYDGRSLPIGFSPVAVESHPLLSRNADELRRNPDFQYQPR
jgi:hypothetical protein